MQNFKLIYLAMCGLYLPTVAPANTVCSNFHLFPLKIDSAAGDAGEAENDPKLCAILLGSWVWKQRFFCLNIITFTVSVYGCAHLFLSFFLLLVQIFPDYE